MAQPYCDHVIEANFTKSLQGKKIFKDQCVKCFNQPKNQEGLFVCMTCFNGFCRDHIQQHQEKHKHILYINIVDTLKNNQKKIQINKLAIGVEGGALGQQQYDTSYHLWCNQCKRHVKQNQNKVESQIKSLINSDSPFKKQALATWEVQVLPCQHTLTLQQFPINKNLQKCASCDLSTNLWLCLTCGNTGCGRKNFDGSGGNSHGITHFQNTGHPLVVKLGTITAQGEASLYCYQCNNDVKDELLADHLQVLGISVRNQTKTQKTVQQINLDINLNFSLSKLLKNNESDISLFGGHFTGMNNIGNTCYLNSVLQTLNHLQQFRNQFYNKRQEHIMICNKIPSECFYCQVSKIFWGLNSGMYSQRLSRTRIINQMQTQEQYQRGIKPFDFKLLIAKNNAQFSSGRQQDALQYLQFIFDRFEKQVPNISNTTVKQFDYQSVNRLVCTKCNGYKMTQIKNNELKFPVPPPSKQMLQKYYKQLQNKDEQTKKIKMNQDPQYHIKFQQCLQLLKGGDLVSVNCPKCKQQTLFTSKQYFKTTPKYLMAVSNRFVLQKWVPKKLNALIQIHEKLNIQQFLINNASKVGQLLNVQAPKYTTQNVQMLVMMGFSQNAAKRALIATKNDAEMATNWIMQHMDDYTINQPLEQEKKNTQLFNSALIPDILQLGFDEQQAKIALIQNKNNKQAALEWLFTVDGNVSQFLYLLKPKVEEQKQQKINNIYTNYQLKAVIVHLGRSVHSGHYVVYIKTEQDWVLFNDGEVTKAAQPVLGKGYIYVYEGK